MTDFVKASAIVFCLAAFSARGAADDDDENTVKVLHNIPYLGETRKEKMDLYLPTNIPNGQTSPAILIVHGGGWHGGGKAAAREKNIGMNLAKAGYVCASIDYVLAEKKERFTDNLRQVWPRNLQDCMTGVRFLRANAETYHINPERIGAIGGSAGGHLVATLAVVDPKDNLYPEGHFSDFSCRIQAVVPLYGAHDLIALAKKRQLFELLSDQDKKLCQDATPVTHLSEDDPPFLIFHGTRDTLVPVDQSRLLHEAAQKAGVVSELHIIKGAKHSFHLEPKQKDLRPIVIEFFDRHLKSTDR